ncbi:MAG: YlqD family protein [Alicyclobacillaceae bacterium]|jgi:seryl-tRNA synthetase|uniref:YlqD family protein n=1 Tax=Alicyclobacillus sp. SP_1 TaxID=2942475 RepID=UPI00215705EE|nr:YlqD family protein [Alicyclobacillus sp. SP_1]MCY0886894.1 YlqD family protein [Alicyclobacillaceae bacterium]MCY0895905.1 YlqD family protein [Alicyclobacillaceae bacterium]
MEIRQPVAVKFILTETAKQEIIAEQRRQIEQLSNELDQIEEQGKAAIEQAMSQGGEVAKQVREQVEVEKNNRLNQREQLIQSIQQIQQLELGTEIQNMNVETVIDVRVGDDWTKVLAGSEIVIKDGVVIDIRRAGQSFQE